MNIRKVFEKMPIARSRLDSLLTEVKTSEGKELSLKKITQGASLLNLLWDQGVRGWVSGNCIDNNVDVIEVNNKMCREIFYHVDMDIIFISSLMMYNIGFVECAFEKKFAPILEIGEKHGWRYVNCVMFEGDKEIPFYLFDFEIDQKEVEEIFDLILPEGGKIKFEGRKSKNEMEFVTLYLPHEFCEQFSRPHNVCVWGKYLSENWGKCKAGGTQKNTYQFYPPENGGSIIPSVCKKLVKELGEARATLERDRGYKPLVIEKKL
jgi:hypothetical protein